MRVAIVLLLASLAAPAAVAETFKPFKLKTLDGEKRALADVLGKATLVVFFFPTCPYCNAAFPDIQKLHDTYKDAGLSMVWINVVPDEERLIADWRARHGYTVPILLGGRSVQNDYKLVMTPTYYLLDSEGNVLSRHAGHEAGDEKKLEQEIREALGIPVASHRTPHLSFNATLSPAIVEPGSRMSIIVDVVPNPGIHVYAPGTQYRPIAVRLEPHPLLRVHAPAYPEPTRYFFEPLKEEVLVYSAPFRLAVDVTAGETEEQRIALRARRTLAVDGMVEYQACDDRVCYLPTTIPVRWVVPVKDKS